MTLVLVADRASRSVSLACQGRGFAALSARSTGLLLSTVTTERPAAAIEFGVVGRSLRTCVLRVRVLGPQATVTLTADRLVLHRLTVVPRSALATAAARAVAHLTGPDIR
ncbi:MULTISPECIES: hypothetical protein [Actinoalloteichus]|uniref:Uncharacterized protein n=1 Tax=Actinoalloteichus fjordicus TaxID=1612552 RepID=A0AAC9LFT5_9PSEU|nr:MULTISPECIES: hypothetical protein [Actinoalloteichus]APU15977.1 hypothetical protein UA74_19760 [Actinoalloteichus fjordicus]APU22041.1 hypothetical protein UA75_20260 [Actinoalloteichus sp. GBA129-24]